MPTWTPCDSGKGITLRTTLLIMPVLALFSGTSALADPAACPQKMKFDDQVHVLEQGQIALGDRKEDPTIEKNVSALGHNNFRYDIDLMEKYYVNIRPRFLICLYGPMTSDRQLIVTLPEDITRCQLTWHNITSSQSVDTRITCRNPSGVSAGANIAKAEYITARTEIGGYRLRLTKDQIYSLAETRGDAIKQTSQKGEVVFDVSHTEGNDQEHITFSNTTNTVRKIAISRQSKEATSYTLYLSYVARFSYPWLPTKNAMMDGFHLHDQWHSHGQDDNQVELQFWTAGMHSNFAEIIQFVDLTDPQSKAEMSTR